MRWSRKVKPYAWTQTPPEGKPVVLDHWDGQPTVVLFPTADGSALLWWQFSGQVEGERVGVLTVHLTDAEANRVAETGPMDGVLEKVRPKLRDQHALVHTIENGQTCVREFVVPRDTSEWEFAAELDAAAATAPAFRKAVLAGMEADIASARRHSKSAGAAAIEQSREEVKREYALVERLNAGRQHYSGV